MLFQLCRFPARLPVQSSRAPSNQSCAHNLARNCEVEGAPFPEAMPWGTGCASPQQASLRHGTAGGVHVHHSGNLGMQQYGSSRHTLHSEALCMHHHSAIPRALLHSEQLGTQQYGNIQQTLQSEELAMQHHSATPHALLHSEQLGMQQHTTRHTLHSEQHSMRHHSAIPHALLHSEELCTRHHSAIPPALIYSEQLGTQQFGTTMHMLHTEQPGMQQRSKELCGAQLWASVPHARQLGRSNSHKYRVLSPQHSPLPQSARRAVSRTATGLPPVFCSPTHPALSHTVSAHLPLPRRSRSR